MIKQGINLLQEAEGYVNQAMDTDHSVQDDVAKDLENRIDQLAEDAKPLAAAEVMDGTNVPSAPADSSATMGDSSQNEKFAAQLALNRVQAVESSYDKIFDQLKQIFENDVKNSVISSIDMMDLMLI